MLSLFFSCNQIHIKFTFKYCFSRCSLDKPNLLPPIRPKVLDCLFFRWSYGSHSGGGLDKIKFGVPGGPGNKKFSWSKIFSPICDSKHKLSANTYSQPLLNKGSDSSCSLTNLMMIFIYC